MGTESDLSSLTWSGLTFVLFIFSFALSYAHKRYPTPILALINRWLRWIIFSLFFAYILTWFEDMQGKPYWLLVLTGFLMYTLLETVYNWIAIGALSRSDMALFPSFRKNSDGDEWPSHSRFFATKEWIRNNGFSRLESIKAELDEDLFIRSSIYQNKDGTIRLQVIFFPQRAGHISMSYVFSSKEDEETRYISDNVNMPFGGFYPETWVISRKPLVKSIDTLYKHHKKQIKAASLVPWEDDPLCDLNEQQRLLEKTNRHKGFLLPPDMQEDHGRISGEGRYRLWKEVWILNYFGRSTC